MNVLEDEEERLAASAEIADAGGALEWASTGAAKQALELVREHEFAVVITDVEMPCGDGMPLLRHVAEYHPGTSALSTRLKLRRALSSRAAWRTGW